MTLSGVSPSSHKNGIPRIYIVKKYQRIKNIHVLFKLMFNGENISRKYFIVTLMSLMQ